jgi:hypothetical protein
MLMSIRLSVACCFTLGGCVAANEPKTTWDLGNTQPQLLISAAKITRDQISFQITIENTSEFVLCFDGNEVFPVGLGLQSAVTGSILPGSDGGVPPNFGVGFPVNAMRYVIEPQSSQSFAVSVGRPISGFYEVPFTELKYQKGDLLVARASTEFYDCSFASDQLAAVQGRSIIVLSAPSSLFRED